MSAKTRLTLLSVIVLVVSPPAFAASPTETSDPRQRGYHADFDLLEPPVVVWSFEQKPQKNVAGKSIAPGLSDPLVANGVVYVGDDHGILRAFDSTSGRQLWRHEHGTRIYNTPSSDGEHVYITTRAGVVALHCKDGSVAWRQDIEGASRSVTWPARALGPRKVRTLFFGNSAGLLHALDARTGKQKWNASLLPGKAADPPAGFDGERARGRGSKARPTGIATDGKVVIQSVFDQSRAVAFECVTGNQLWSFQTKGWIWGAAAIGDDDVFLASQDKKLYCLEKETGKQKWSFETKGRIESGVGVHETLVFITSCDGNLYCLDRKTGEQHWQAATEPDYTGRKFIYTLPIVTDTSVYLAAGEGQVYSFNRADGKLRWKLRPSEHSQLYCSAVTDGRRIFVTSRPSWNDKGVSALYAIGAKE